MDKIIIKEPVGYSMPVDCVKKLNNLFYTRDEYVKHMRLLKCLQEMLWNRLSEGDNSISPLFDTINQVYGSLLDDEFMKFNR